MIVEPVPTNSPSRRRRVLARLALLVPVVLLAAVVGIAVLGRNPTPDRPLAALEAATPDAPAGPSAEPGASARPPATIPTVLQPRRPPFPSAIDGLVVQSVPQALEGPAVERSGEVVAIGGYFGLPIVPTDCGDGIDPLGPLCERTALLTEVPWSLVGSEGFSGIGPHVHAVAPLGLRLPDQIQRTTMAASGGPLTAVLIGRFGDFIQDGCTEAGAACEARFDLEAVAWAEGSPFQVRPFVDPSIHDTPPEWITSNQSSVGGQIVGPNGIVLRIALVRPAMLGDLDPHAARRVRDADPARYVWYVRGLRPALDGGSVPELVWGVVDDTTLETLDTGLVRPRPLREADAAPRIGAGRDYRV